MSAATLPPSATTSSIRHRPVAKSTLHTGKLVEASDSESSDDDGVATFTPPNFTVKDLLGAIPKHCFERSGWISSLYLAGDLAMLATFAFLATFIDGSFGKSGSLVDGVAGQVLRVLAWALYILCAGSVGTGVWVIAHECGHQAYSTSKTLNNAVGWVCHSALLVPYHSWRISHARHHAATGSMERDEVFVPNTRSEVGIAPENETITGEKQSPEPKKSLFNTLDDIFEDAPLWNLFQVVVQQTLGWPMYLINNASGQDYGRWTNHFDPSAPIFDKRHFMQIVASDIGLCITGAALTIWGMNRGFAEVAKYYLLPYLVVNHHLVMITFLQHTSPDLVHYRAAEWNFARGALCTIDRNLGGRIGAYVFHGICETHVAHHICSRIPHHNAWEATEAIKNFLGPYYMKSDENMYSQLLKTKKDCVFVEDTGSCLVYKNRQGKAKLRVVYESDSGMGNSASSSDSESKESDEEI